MRKCVVVAATAALVACGSSSSSGGGGGGTGALTGTLAGASFTPTEGGALIVAPTNCTMGSTPLHVSGLVVGFGSYAGLCNFITMHTMCADKANATLVGVEVFKAGLSQTQSAVGAGTYTVTTGTPVPDANGNFMEMLANYNKTNATCVSTNDSDANGGSITVSSVTGTSVTGSVSNLAFADGSHLNGTFDVSICNVTIDVCALINSTCTSPPCIP